MIKRKEIDLLPNDSPYLKREKNEDGSIIWTVNDFDDEETKTFVNIAILHSVSLQGAMIDSVKKYKLS